MSSITVRYFALLQELTGLESQRLELSANDTADTVYQRLSQEHGLSIAPTRLRVAINDRFADWTDPLNPEDRVAFLPPMSGG